MIDYTNYCLGSEAATKILLYSGKTEGELWNWVSGEAGVGPAPRSNGLFAGLPSKNWQEIKSTLNSKDPKYREQVGINTCREAERLFPDVVSCENVNNVAKYRSVKTIDKKLLQSILEFIQGTRFMAEKKMAANHRKVSLALAKMKKVKKKPAKTSPESEELVKLMSHPRALEYLREGIRIARENKAKGLRIDGTKMGA